MREGAGYSDTLFWHNISRFLWLCLSDFSGAILTDATGSNRAPYSFKYGGNISILGYLTNIVSSDTEKKGFPNNEFAGCYSTLNQVMLNLYKNKDRIFIVHPIALFY